jgi:hypothetical protein
LVRVVDAHGGAMIHDIYVNNFNNIMGVLIPKSCRLDVACHIYKSNASVRGCSFATMSE